MIKRALGILGLVFFILMLLMLIVILWRAAENKLRHDTIVKYLLQQITLIKPPETDIVNTLSVIGNFNNNSNNDSYRVFFSAALFRSKLSQRAIENFVLHSGVGTYNQVVFLENKKKTKELLDKYRFILGLSEMLNSISKDEGTYFIVCSFEIRPLILIDDTIDNLGVPPNNKEIGDKNL